MFFSLLFLFLGLLGIGSSFYFLKTHRLYQHVFDEFKDIAFTSGKTEIREAFHGFVLAHTKAEKEEFLKEAEDHVPIEIWDRWSDMTEIWDKYYSRYFG